MLSRRKYQKHCFNDLENIELDFKNETLKDGKRQYKALLPTINQLKELGVTNLENISDMFKENGFSASYMKKLILFLSKSLNIDLPIREIGKFNSSYRNLILNLILRKNGDETLQLIKEFISKEHLNTDDLLIHLLKNKTQELNNEIKLHQQMETTNCNNDEFQLPNTKGIDNFITVNKKINLDAAADPILLNRTDLKSMTLEDDTSDFYFYDDGFSTNPTNF